MLLIDANVSRMPYQEVVRQLEQFKPQAMAFTLSTYAFTSTVEWMGRLKSHFRIPTIAGGINPRLYPVETIANPAIDYCVLHFATRGLSLCWKRSKTARPGRASSRAPGPDGNPVTGLLTKH